VELGMAATDTFEFIGYRLQRFYRGGEIPPLERGKSARHCRNQSAGRITPLLRQRVNLLRARLDRRIIARHGRRERDVHIGERRSGTRKRVAREVVHRAPRGGVTRMPGELPTPQKRYRIVQLAARRTTVHVWPERFPEQVRRCRR